MAKTVALDVCRLHLMLRIIIKMWLRTGTGTGKTTIVGKPMDRYEFQTDMN